MKKIKIAVMGSCISRDVFNSQFNKDYKDYYECVLTQFQSSIISVMSEEIEYDDNRIDNLEKHAKWQVKTEFTKEFLTKLKESKPDYILMDFFGDIHFGVIKLRENQYLTNNRWKVMKTTYFKELPEKNILTVDKNTVDFLVLWKEYIDKFYFFVKNELPDTKVIVVETENTDQFLTNNEIKKISTSGRVMPIDVNLFNKLWQQLNNYVIKTHGSRVINMMDKKYLSYEEHPWGPFYVHYTPDFYHDFLQKLHTITLGDYFIDKEIDVFKNIYSDSLLYSTSLNNELKTEIDSVKKELEKTKSELLGTKKALDKSVSRVKELTEKDDKEIMNLKKSLVDLEASFKELKNLNEELTAEKVKLTKNIKKDQKRIEQYRNEKTVTFLKRKLKLKVRKPIDRTN